MPTKTIGIREEVYERLRARKRNDESFTDVIDRLIDESDGDWRDGFGSISSEEAGSLQEAAAASRQRFNESAGERQAAAIDLLADAPDEAVTDGDDERSDDDADLDDEHPETGGSA